MARPPRADAPAGAGAARAARARLFLALDLPDRERAAIAAWRDAGIAGRPGLRPVDAAALHVTLVFLGAQPEEAVEAIAAEALDPLRGLPAPVLAPLGLRPLPPRRPRLYALDLEDRDGTARRVQAAAADALALAGRYRPERRPFWPHVTLARVRSGARPAPPRADPPPRVRFTAAQATLYRSRPSAQGARYEPVARVVLSS